MKKNFNNVKMHGMYVKIIIRELVLPYISRAIYFFCIW